jgi:hypothetical protein
MSHSPYQPAKFEKRLPGHAVWRALTVGAPVAAIVAVLILFGLTPPIGWTEQAPFRADIIWIVRTAIHYSQLGHPVLNVAAVVDGVRSAGVELTTSFGLGPSSAWRILTIYGAACSGALAVGVMTYSQTPYVDIRTHYAGLRLFRAPAGTFSANKFLAREIKKYGAGLLLAPRLRLSLMRELRNILLIAAPNSGKTRIILFLIEQILAKMKNSSGTTRLLLHDTTGELRRGLPLPDNDFAALHPHRPDGWAWAIGKDVREPFDAFAFASRLIGPTTGGENRMFDSGAVIGLTGCILLTMQDLPENWGVGELRDTILDDPIEWRERLLTVYAPAAALIVIDPETGGLNRTTASFILSFRAYVLGLLEPLANAWRDTPQERRFSFVDWLHGVDENQPATVVLVRSARHAELSEKWIGAVVDIVASYACDESFNEDRRLRTYLVLDELHQLGRLARLPEILDVGRNKQISVIASYQDSIQPRKDYGDDGAQSLIARFATKIIGQMPLSEDSRKISEAIIGSRDVLLGGGAARDDKPEKPITTPIVREEFLAYQLGPDEDETKALIIGLGDVVEITWPETVWQPRR